MAGVPFLFRFFERTSFTCGKWRKAWFRPYRKAQGRDANGEDFFEVPESHYRSVVQGEKDLDAGSRGVLVGMVATPSANGCIVRVSGLAPEGFVKVKPEDGDTADYPEEFQVSEANFCEIESDSDVVSESDESASEASVCDEASGESDDGNPALPYRNPALNR